MFTWFNDFTNDSDVINNGGFHCLIGISCLKFVHIRIHSYNNVDDVVYEINKIIERGNRTSNCIWLPQYWMNNVSVNEPLRWLGIRSCNSKNWRWVSWIGNEHYNQQPLECPSLFKAHTVRTYIWRNTLLYRQDERLVLMVYSLISSKTHLLRQEAIQYWWHGSCLDV